MKRRTIILTIILSWAVAGPAAAVESGAGSGLRIHLPRRLTIENDVPTLGQVGVLLGEQRLLDQAEKVTLGRIAMPGQEITVSRAVILSRLAAAGLDASCVMFSGADSVRVSRPHRTVTGGDFVQFASAYLDSAPKAPGVRAFEPVAAPPDLVLAEPQSALTFTASAAKSPAANLAIVEIEVKQAAAVVDSRRVVFRARYNRRVVKATADIAAGEFITHDNVLVETVASDYPESADWVAPYGLAARRAIAAGSTVGLDILAPARPQAVIKRNQNVIIQIDRLGLLITATGRALQVGGTGQFIKVQNIDSQRVIICKVRDEGTVEPVF